MESGGRLLDTKFASFLLWLLFGLLSRASAENGEALTSNFCEALVVVVLFIDKSIVISNVVAAAVFFGSVKLSELLSGLERLRALASDVVVLDLAAEGLE